MSATSLKPYNTFKLESYCDNLHIPKTIDDLVTLLNVLKSPIVLGNGSNVIMSEVVGSDVIITGGLKDIELTDATISVSCGTKVQLLSAVAATNCLTGFEFLVGIPASLGGVLLMNASAHSQCISDNLVSCRVYDCVTKSILNLKKEECDFAYRHSKFKENTNYVILDATFELLRQDKESIDKKMAENISFRKEKQPSLALPNAGSIFKNPKGDSAGRLLDKCNLKGKREGAAMVWDGHANFIINTGGATSKDISLLMFSMYNKVKEEFNLELEPEILFIGEKSKLEREIWDIMLKQK